MLLSAAPEARVLSLHTLLRRAAHASSLGAPSTSGRATPRASVSLRCARQGAVSRAGPETETEGSPLDFPEARTVSTHSCGQHSQPPLAPAGVDEGEPKPPPGHPARVQAAQAAAAAAHAWRPGGAKRRGGGGGEEAEDGALGRAGRGRARTLTPPTQPGEPPDKEADPDKKEGEPEKEGEPDKKEEPKPQE